MFTFLWISDNTAINSLTALAHQTHNPLSICHKQYILGALASSLNCLLLSSCPSDRLFATLFLSVRPSVRLRKLSERTHCKDFRAIDNGNFHENLSRKSKFGKNWAILLDTLYEDRNTFYFFRSH